MKAMIISILGVLAIVLMIIGMGFYRIEKQNLESQDELVLTIHCYANETTTFCIPKNVGTVEIYLPGSSVADKDRDTMPVDIETYVVPPTAIEVLDTQ